MNPRRRSALVAALVLALAGCEASERGAPPVDPPATADEEGPPTVERDADPSAAPFVDEAAARGVAFTHDNGARGERIIPETMGGGGGFLDHDGDGDLDIVLIDGGPLGPDATRPGPRLLRNDGTGHFEDVTAESGLEDNEHGMGLAVGDIDGDGDPDLYIANFGPDSLHRNRGDGTFERVGSGLPDLPTWSSSAAFVDVDGDSALDLYVVSYLDMTLETHHPCSRDGIPLYCPPRDHPPQWDHLLMGDGRGGCVDRSEEMGLRASTPGRGLGVVASDVDDDGDADLYVANDMDLNHLLVNRAAEGKTPALSDEAVFLGGSASEDGRPEAGMGVDAGDFDGDGDFDIIVTNFEDQTNALYRNEGGVGFTEVSYVLGLGVTTLDRLAFGVRFLDHDLDGDLDLYVANGHVDDNTARLRQGSEHAQADQLFENRDGKFHEVLAPEFASGALPTLVGRAVASGDIDGDGDLDLLVVNNGGPAMLLVNRAPADRPRIGLRLQGVAPSNRDAYGAKVTVDSGGGAGGGSGGLRQVFEVRAGSSYLASHDPRIIAATPGATEARVTIRWPSGRVETLESVPAGSYHTIVEGEGIRASIEFRR